MDLLRITHLVIGRELVHTVVTITMSNDFEAGVMQFLAVVSLIVGLFFHWAAQPQNKLDTLVPVEILRTEGEHRCQEDYQEDPGE